MVLAAIHTFPGSVRAIHRTTHRAPADVETIVLAGLQSQLARAYMLAESYERSITAIEPALDAAEHSDDIPLLADALVSFGGCSVPALIGPFQTGADLLAKFLDH
jgi:hypothetical protein